MVKPLQVLLLLAIIATGYWGWQEFQRDNHLLPQATTAKSYQAVPIALPQIEQLALSDFAETVQRPLFFADRRLPDEKAAEANKTAAAKPNNNDRNPPNLRLTAILIVGEQRVAVVEEFGSGENLRFIEGDSHENWRIDQIGERTLSMSNGTAKHKLELLQFAAGDNNNTKPSSGAKPQTAGKPARRLPPWMQKDR